MNFSFHFIIGKNCTLNMTWSYIGFRKIPNLPKNWEAAWSSLSTVVALDEHIFTIFPFCISRETGTSHPDVLLNTENEQSLIFDLWNIIKLFMDHKQGEHSFVSRYLPNAVWQDRLPAKSASDLILELLLTTATGSYRKDPGIQVFV